MSPSQTTIQRPPPPLPTLPPHEMLFPCASWKNGDLHEFPELHAVMERMGENKPNPMASFGDAVSSANGRLWILDPHIFSPDNNSETRATRIEVFLGWLRNSNVQDIKIMTSSGNTNQVKGNDLLQELRQGITRINQSRQQSRGSYLLGNIDIRYTLRKQIEFIHDRFAIIDNDLWHFGATVGGFQKEVNVATHGWDAEQYGAIRFFEQVWNFNS